jgi:lysyl-tRNA synthetase class 1
LSDKFPIHWLEEIVKEISSRKIDNLTLSTGKTPSGQIHLGILREIIICDALRRILEGKGYKVKNLLFFDSLDAAKRFPAYIPKDFQKQHLGKPFAMIPCPFEDCKCKSYAHHFGNELTGTFPDFGIKTKIIWTHELYKTKEMQEKIKIALDNIDMIKEILRKYILPTIKDDNKNEFIEMQKDWMPVMAICEKCNRTLHIEKDGTIKPNRIKKYFKDNEEVSYKCEACDHKGILSIWSGSLKLNWRIDWPAKWAIYKTTCEPAGKDHSVKGGAYDTGLELCQELYGYRGPVKVPYEWLRLGDYDMKTSKGIVFTPEKYIEIADPEIYRTIILRTVPLKHIAFRIEQLPQYYDYYERMENIYFNLDKAENTEEKEFFNYLFPLTQINTVPGKKLIRLPLKLLTFLAQIQNILSIDKLYDKAKEYLKQQNYDVIIEIEEFKKVIDRTSNLLNEINKILEQEKDKKIRDNIIRKIGIFRIPEKINRELLEKLNENQKKGVLLLREYFIENKEWDAIAIGDKVGEIAKHIDSKPRKLFEACYIILLGRTNGPNLGRFLIQLDRDWVLDRFNIKAK